MWLRISTRCVLLPMMEVLVPPCGALQKILSFLVSLPGGRKGEPVRPPRYWVGYLRVILNIYTSISFFLQHLMIIIFYYKIKRIIHNNTINS